MIDPAPVELLAEIDSTNAEALRRAGAGRRDPHWIVALRQTAGRGRRARTWESPAGNLYATLLLPVQVSPARAATLSFVAALAVMDMLDPLAGAERVSLKWPNDVMVAGRKAVGILLESAIQHDNALTLAIGVGVNLAHGPHNPERPAIALADLGIAPPSPQDAASALAAAFARRFAQWEGQGFSATRAAWLARAGGLGRPIIVRLAQETLEGVFAGLDEAGALRLALPEGTERAISAGDVFFPDEGRG